MLPTSTSIAGPLHLAHPSEQGAAVRTLLALFRRAPSASSASKASRSDSRTLKKRLASYGCLECTLDTADASTYTPPSPTPSSSSCANDLPPPPPYTAVLPTHGAEEDLFVLDDAPAPETPAEAKQRRKADKLERKRRELIEADRRMDEALKSYGW
ncbi:hypothetical protein JCM10207_000690 [Rhodosporidiobolus poonsookiae]